MTTVRGCVKLLVPMPRNKRPNTPPEENDMTDKEWPLYEVFIRSKSGLSHRHAGSIHAADDQLALDAARDTYTRRNEGVSIWVVRSSQIVASDPAENAAFFEPAEDKIYRHPTFYEMPDGVDNL
jgi:ring-1,2-phenylacetyl-CoA epoxidase subunit PaaB